MTRMNLEKYAVWKKTVKKATILHGSIDTECPEEAKL